MWNPCLRSNLYWNNLAITVACLASFRNLFSRENSHHRPKRYEPPNTSDRFLQGSKSRNKMRNLIDTLASNSDYTNSSYQVQVDSGHDTQSMIDHHHDPHNQIRLDKAVHVRKDVDLVHEPSLVWRLSNQGAVMDFFLEIQTRDMNSSILALGIFGIVYIYEGACTLKVQMSTSCSKSLLNGDIFGSTWHAV